MKVIAIGGEPATGKTTLMMKFRETLSSPSMLKWGKLLAETYSKEKLVIFGDYRTKQTFAGTDRLSMAVQPDAIDFVKYASRSATHKNGILLFEGDRLFTKTFLQACEQTPNVQVKVIVLRAPEALLETRHAQRADTQTKTFLRGRRTKIENIINAYPQTELWDSLEQDRLVSRLQSICSLNLL